MTITIIIITIAIITVIITITITTTTTIFDHIINISSTIILPLNVTLIERSNTRKTLKVQNHTDQFIWIKLFFE